MTQKMSFDLAAAVAVKLKRKKVKVTNLTLGTPLYAVHRVWAVLLHLGLRSHLLASESSPKSPKELHQ